MLPVFPSVALEYENVTFQYIKGLRGTLYWIVWDKGNDFKQRQ